MINKEKNLTEVEIIMKKYEKRKRNITRERQISNGMNKRKRERETIKKNSRRDRWV